MSTAVDEPLVEAIATDRSIETMQDLLVRLGGVAPDRVLLSPPPGAATEADLLRLPHEVQKICELIDGTLVVKAVGAPESSIAMDLVMYLGRYPGIKKLTVVLGPDGHTRYFGGHIRMPDVAVFLRSRLPDGKLPHQQICPVAPNFAVEVLSPGNTKREIEKKLRTFFDSGVQLAWVVDPRRRTVRVHTSADAFTEVGEDGTVNVGDILPGFTLSVREWFEEAD
ncbi:MAG: Uma2 family endonuclease [Planctomycetaceae bacterium]